MLDCHTRPRKALQSAGAALLLVAMLLVALSPGAQASAPVMQAENNAGASIEFVDLPEGLGVTVDGDLFTVLRHDASLPYLYPVLGPGGVAVTRGYPMELQPGEAEDHPHHRSLWLAHGSV